MNTTIGIGEPVLWRSDEGHSYRGMVTGVRPSGRLMLRLEGNRFSFEFSKWPNEIEREEVRRVDHATACYQSA